MKRKPSELALVAISLLCILTLAACGNSTPTLRYITISPATSTISVGTTQQYTATGYYSNGSITPSFAVTWGSSSPAIATIDQTGVATGVAPGTTMITATALGITASPVTLNVNQLLSIAITPVTATVAAGGTQQYAATGTFKNPDGTTGTSDVTTLATWNATPATVATIDNTTNIGLATAVAAGAATITASLDGITSNSATLTVGAPVPQSLVISPASPTAAIGNSVPFTAQEKWSDGTLHTPAGPVSWTSATTATATIQASTGQALALAAGTSVVTATENTFTATATLTVVVGSSHYAYVSNNLGNTIQWYSVSTTTSPYLTSQGTLPATGPTQLVIHPSGQYLYYTDDNSNVWVTTVNPSTGALTATAFPSQVGGSGNANFTAIDTYGRFLYVSDDLTGTIHGFQISQTDGSLTPISGSPFTANLNFPECLIIDPTSTYLYATNEGNDTISAYTIDQTSGALTPLSTPTFATGSGPYLGGLDPSGTHLYVANVSANTISGFSIGTGGVLTSVGADTPVTGATSIENVVVDPSGTHIYALDLGTATGQVFGFNVGAGGVIGSAISGTPVATGGSPLAAIVVDRTGTLLAVDNNATNDISPFTIGSGGALTAAPPVTAGSSPLFMVLYNAP